uniref:Uncharacterized protein n=1 Tax=Caenorhabditis japonica TaxID=281687 RepID=A0A8R1IXT1_CAEJA
MIAFRRCKKSRDPKYGEHCDVPHMRNTRVLVPTNPPPLPPRRLRNDSHFGGISTSNTNRPMVQVKPFSNIPEIHEVRSPSACESLIGGRREKLSEATSSNRARKSDRCISQDDALSSLQEGDDSIVHLVDDRIDLALRYSRAVDGALIVGETELMPVVNDDDYMTMKPRNDRNFERDDKKPQIPAHAAPLSPALYDRISENSDAFNSID